MRFSGLARLAAALIAVAALASSAQGRVSAITITGTTPAYGGTSFGAVGAYQMVTGIAYGEVDPKDRRSAIIQDIALAPRNAKGMVEYSTQFQILMPVDPAKGNRTLLTEIVNRGRGLSHGPMFNLGISSSAPDGDGFLETQGFTSVLVGWQADVSKGSAAAPLIGMTAPVATDHGKTITGAVRTEWIVARPMSTMNISTPDGNQNSVGYPAAAPDNAGLTLTERVTQKDARSVIPNSDWAFADCTRAPFPGTPDPRKVCLRHGFDTNHIYELVYTAKDPIVMGLGLAALRDAGAFFRHAPTDDSGVANPLAGRIDHTMISGISQSGRLLRTFLALGFNEDEQGRIVYEGAQPHIAVAGDAINIRFGQPGRLAGTEHTEAQFPGTDSPMTYEDEADPLTGRSGGILDRCTRTNTCPRIVQTMSDIEYWQSAGRADTTDARGTRDAQIPANVRIYQFSGTQHSGFSPTAPLPVAAADHCQRYSDANPYVYNLRAALVALRQWVADGVAPPPSAYSRIADSTLTPLDRLAYPTIPGFSGPQGIFNVRTVYDRGARFDAKDLSGILEIEPPVAKAQYPSLAPNVDADGNDTGGVRSHILQAPLGTYSGWNVRTEGFSKGDSCDLTGGYIPFAVTRAERIASGDPRLSLEERYTNSAGYGKAVTLAIDALIRTRYMLAADRQNAIDTASAWFTQASKGKLP